MINHNVLINFHQKQMYIFVENKPIIIPFERKLQKKGPTHIISWTQMATSMALTMNLNLTYDEPQIKSKYCTPYRPTTVKLL